MLSRFLTELFEHGNVRLGAELPEFEVSELTDATRILIAHERHVAADFPAPVPALDLASAGWGARQLFLLTHLIVHRRVGVETMREILGKPCPHAGSASQHYSVDLTLRYLPDVDRLSATLSPDDPLRAMIRDLGAEWPLSSAGIKGCQPRRVTDVLAHDGLRREYIDRIVEWNDTSRLADESTFQMTRGALGAERASKATWCRQPASVNSQNPPSTQQPASDIS